jgi:hypothetical protein
MKKSIFSVFVAVLLIGNAYTQIVPLKLKITFTYDEYSQTKNKYGTIIETYTPKSFNITGSTILTQISNDHTRVYNGFDFRNYILSYNYSTAHIVAYNPSTTDIKDLSSFLNLYCDNQPGTASVYSGSRNDGTGLINFKYAANYYTFTYSTTNNDNQAAYLAGSFILYNSYYLPPLTPYQLRNGLYPTPVIGISGSMIGQGFWYNHGGIFTGTILSL